MTLNDNSRNFDIVPPHLAVKAMRDNGYQNAAYAVAELMDNSIEAKASQVELLCADKTSILNHRRTTRIHEIAVLDNGEGMDSETLRIALQFGNGTRLEESQQKGIGRFGMGLPNSSISQCKRVDVWSWQEGIHNALYTYLDLDQIVSEEMREVPEPQPRHLPDLWQTAGAEFGNSGTLVVWSKIDRCRWRRSDALIKNSELLVGRMYRRFLGTGQVRIRFLSFDVDELENAVEDWARPNDPLYLMHNTSCPDDPPYVQEGKPMFKPWATDDGTSADSYGSYTIRFRGQEHCVQVRYSIAKSATLLTEGQDAGARSYGQHAKKNAGVSIVRAERELNLDSGWTNPSEPRDRFWGVEVDFPPALDDLFGVTNNKQAAQSFSDLAKVNFDDPELLGEHKSYLEARREYRSEQDPEWALFEIGKDINKHIRTMRGILQKVRAGRRSRSSDAQSNGSNLDLAEQDGTERTYERVKGGREGRTDLQERLPREERIDELKNVLPTAGIVDSLDEAEGLAAEVIDRGLKYRFETTHLSTPGFFDVLSRAGVNIIALNVGHPAYDHLISVLESDISDATEDELRDRLSRASYSLRMLLISWARYEDEQPDGPRLLNAQRVRWEWGMMAQEFLDNEG